VIEVAGRGLVVLLGCEHAGVVNTVAHALALTHSSRLAAVAGGFHLGTPAAILRGPRFLIQSLPE
jgi:7,8-dihydropterin-6-yl-methyl-4-(beta-D-ribofuranosyl)aminobenzene 5'-phosphate synthase